MNVLTSILKRISGFRARLLGIVSLGIISLALTASLTTAWVTSNRAAEQMIAQGLQIVETLAEQSVLALIYASPQNATEPLHAIMSFPGVIKAGIYQNDRQPLAIQGAQNLSFPEFAGNQPLQHPKLVLDTQQDWHFVAPVMTGGPLSPLDDEEVQLQLGNTNSERLGYAYVVIDKSALHEMQVNIFLNNIIIALSFALLLTLLVNFGINRLIRPLFELIKVMEVNEKEGTGVHADLEGPIEITDLAKVFNRLMSSIKERDKRLREHGERLEAEVAIRTRELVKAHDAALTANRHKSEFLANISHELRTPLQAIIGYADLVREELEMEGMEDNAKELELVIRNANRLLSLINNILDMTKIEAGKMHLHLEKTDLPQLLSEAGDTIKPLLKQNNNRLGITSSGPTNSLEIDRDKLYQVVLNLLSNAGKFTRNGSVELRSELTERQLVISVKDTGIGLAPEQQEIIFDEFHQIDGSTTRDFDGTGLGLAITKRFTELMGGKISVQSELGAGATFFITIPLPIRIPSEFISKTTDPRSAEHLLESL